MPWLAGGVGAPAKNRVTFSGRRGLTAVQNIAPIGLGPSRSCERSAVKRSSASRLSSILICAELSLGRT